MPKFSIVIPTRNRANTLYYTLKTCLNQRDFDDYEIVVSDNDSSDNIAGMTRELNSDKIKYYKTERFIAMTDHFNFALSKATGEYMLFLGSDDAIHTHGLYLLDKIFSITGEKVINWRINGYHWPDSLAIHCKNNLQLWKHNTSTIKNAKNNVKKIVNGSAGIFDMPQLYVYSACHKNIINELINKTGVVYDSISPDIYSGFAISSLVKYYMTIGVPVCMAGASGKSIGATAYYKDISKDVIATSNKNFKGKFLPAGVRVYIESALMDDFDCAKKKLNAFSDIRIDLGKFIDIVIKECYTKNMYFGNTGKENFQKDLNIISQVIENNAEYKTAFTGEGLNICDYKFYEPIYNRIPTSFNGFIKFDASKFEIENINDAVLFAEKLLYSKEYIDVYLDEFEKNWNKIKSIFEELREYLNKYRRIGIFATGEYTKRVLEGLGFFGYENPDIFLFDNSKKEFYDYNVLPPESIPNQKLDILLISSPKFQDEIYESVKQYSQTMEIVKLCDKLGDNLTPGFIFE